MICKQERQQAAARFVGHKIGLTSRAMQMAPKMIGKNVTMYVVIRADFGPLGSIGVSFS